MHTRRGEEGRGEGETREERGGRKRLKERVGGTEREKEEGREIFSYRLSCLSDDRKLGI